MFILVLATSTAHAEDLYSLFNSCAYRRHTGVLAHVDDQRVVLVDLQGRVLGLWDSAPWP